MQDLTQKTTGQTLDLKFSMMSGTPSQRVEQTVFRFLDAKVEENLSRSLRIPSQAQYLAGVGDSAYPA